MDSEPTVLGLTAIDMRACGEQAGNDSEPGVHTQGRRQYDITAAEKLVGEEAREIDSRLAKRVLWKIDLWLMPAMVIGM